MPPALLPAVAPLSPTASPPCGAVSSRWHNAVLTDAPWVAVRPTLCSQTSGYAVVNVLGEKEHLFVLSLYIHTSCRRKLDKEFYFS